MLAIPHKLERIVLLAGDIAFLYIALYATLLLRYLEMPSQATLEQHVTPFSILFIAWVAVFYLTGLYDKQTTFLKGRLPSLILNAQIANTIIAALFFFFIPLFSIAPKTNLVIYLAISTALIIWWRLRLAPRLSARKKQPALLVGFGDEASSLRKEIQENPRYPFFFVEMIDPASYSAHELAARIKEEISRAQTSVVVLDLYQDVVKEAAAELYGMMLRGVRFIEMGRLYEDVFDRLPVSLLPYQWLVSNVSTSPKPFYDVVKRGIDIAGAFVLGACSVVLYPVIMLLIYLDDGRPFFFTQERVGKNGEHFLLLKFRTMSDHNPDRELRVTRIGRTLRRTRLDELPQLWNIFRGDLSFIGPRPEVPSLVEVYVREIPYYHVRHFIKPGLSGWAQINHHAHPHHDVDVAETRNKLSYDLYYVKERSVLMDLHIAFQTVKILLSRSGA